MSGLLVEPIPGEPAAVAQTTRRGFPERSLVVADYHAGIEAGLRYERGVELPSNAAVRRERLLSLLDQTDADRLVVLGDLGHRIGDPKGAEAEELTDLVEAVTDRAEMMLVPGNHDGGLADFFGDSVEVTDRSGVRLGDVGFCHGHTWPSRDVLAADVVCSAHEHPAVRLEDEVGGARKERAWLRGRLVPDVFAEHFDVDVAELEWRDPELVLFPAFNNTSGGTWVNVPGQGFLSPFLPDGLADGEAYLLDGTRLGDYRNV
ncbi:phosphoesterase [Haloferax sp. MBLA0076]|uniref:Phosphoesterase n=1 Tax=Haloferax litoreum TaxID=2666140 RepID=A0A6A8GJN4_9EURY|nr:MULTISPECIES: metallophosphoesterase [Haloferax]KAB1194434.1 metallophosphoesterase [Haloferax sp. CBA1148]MRX23001.1 phosphoesterase [Haloferax litoreum]